ncbi:MAG: DUF4328 domain-containing protein [Ilumatobacteraceae bacterium]
MSDAGSPAAPPPPPNLTPPPAYGGYSPNDIAPAPLRRVGGMRTAILVLLGVYMLAALISIVATPAVVDASEEYLAGGLRDEEFLERLAVNGIAGLLTVGATVALLVLSIIWLQRVVSNHRAIGRRTTWSPGWAIGGWFVPPLIVYAVPMLVLRESWMASDPTVEPGDDRWRKSGVNPIIYVWWVLYGLVPIVFIGAGVAFQTGNLGGDEDELAESLIDGAGFTVAQSIVGILSAIAWALIVRGITARHTALTGEAAAR